MGPAGTCPQALAPVPWWTSPARAEVGGHGSERPQTPRSELLQGQGKGTRAGGGVGLVATGGEGLRVFTTVMPLDGPWFAQGLDARCSWVHRLDGHKALSRSRKGAGRGCLTTGPQAVPGMPGVTWGVRGRVTRARWEGERGGSDPGPPQALPPPDRQRLGGLWGRRPIFNEQITVLVNSTNRPLRDQGNQGLGNSH